MFADNDDEVPELGSPEGNIRLAALFCRDPLFKHAESLTKDARSALERGDADAVEDAFLRAHAWLGVLSILQGVVEQIQEGISQARHKTKVTVEQLNLFNLSSAKGEKVYFQTDGEFVKIGRTIRPEHKRRKENQTGNPRHLTTLAVIPNADEKKIAARFVADHVRGEWYRMSDDLMAFIKAWQLVEGVFA